MATGRVPTTANSPLTAKGDLFTYSTAPARLAVGADGETIVADSSTATGLRYQATQAAGKNAIINGGFDIWQRGTSFTTNGAYWADRWYGLGSAHTISRQSTNDTTNLPFIQYCMRIQRNSGSTSTTAIQMGSNVETANAIPFAGRTVTLSYYARAGANFSGASNVITTQFYTGTGTDQNAFSGYTGSVTALNVATTLTTTWQRFQHTISIGSTVTEFMPYFAYTPTGTAGANDWFEITGIQLEIGSVATTFTRAGGTIQGELAACQRYYERLTAAMVYEQFGVGQGNNGSTTQVLSTVYFKVPKRAAVSSTVDYSTLGAYDTVAIQAISSLSMSFAGINSATVLCTTSGITALRYYQIMANNSTSAYIGFSAEL